MNLVGREQYIITQMYSSGQIIDDTSNSIFNELLEASETYDRYVSILDDTDLDFISFVPSLTYFTNYLNVNDDNEVANTTILLSSMTEQGFHAALTVLQLFSSEIDEESSTELIKSTGKHRFSFNWIGSDEEFLGKLVHIQDTLCTSLLAPEMKMKALIKVSSRRY